MAYRPKGPVKPPGGRIDHARLDALATSARKDQDERMRGYREQSLRIHPWVCARCGRVFDRENLLELTVHHKDHNHDNNPADGSNWENLCIYCHDNEHSRYHEHLATGGSPTTPETLDVATHKPFESLQALLFKKKS